MVLALVAADDILTVDRDDAVSLAETPYNLAMLRRGWYRPPVPPVTALGPNLLTIPEDTMTSPLRWCDVGGAAEAITSVGTAGDDQARHTRIQALTDEDGVSTLEVAPSAVGGLAGAPRAITVTAETDYTLAMSVRSEVGNAVAQIGCWMEGVLDRDLYSTPLLIGRAWTRAVVHFRTPTGVTDVWPTLFITGYPGYFGLSRCSLATGLTRDYTASVLDE